MPSSNRSSTPSPATAVSLDSAVLNDVPVTLQAKLGEATLSVADLLGLSEGSIVSLDRSLNDVIELRLNNAVIARGEIVAVGDRFGVRITNLSEAG
jgi:flagellar motor switch protein FliN/FliY